MSLVATSRKTTDQIFMKILPKMCLRTRKMPFNFGIHPYLDSERGLYLWTKKSLY